MKEAGEAWALVPCFFLLLEEMLVTIHSVKIFLHGLKIFYKKTLVLKF